MAFIAGPPPAKSRSYPMPGQGSVFVLDLTRESEPILLEQSKGAEPFFTWKPNAAPQELYFLTQDSSELVSSEFKGFKISKNSSSLFFSETLHNIFFDSPLKMEWNPKGNLLVSFHIFSCLRFSYDGGKTFITTNLKVAGHDNLVWIEDERFYMNDDSDNEDRIIEISIHDGQAEIIKTIASGKSGQVILAGSVDNEVAYKDSNSIYVGDKKIYKSDTKMWWAVADGSFVALQEQPRQKDNSVSILDKNGKLIRKKTLPKETILIGLSAQLKSIYLLEDFNAIKSWQFMDSNEVKTLYRISR